MASSDILPIRISFGIPISPGQTIERFVYAYALDGDRLCLIDTAVAGAEKMIAAALRKTGRDLPDIGVILLTHSHPDHIGSAALIQPRSGAAVWAHGSEQAWIEDTDRQVRERPVPGFADLVSGPVKVDRLLEDGDVLNLGDRLRFRVMHTPGHSSGSISLVENDRGIVFCGDAVPQPGGMPIYEDVAALAQSLVRLAGIQRLNTLYSSWADPVHGPDAVDAIRAGMRFLRQIDNVVKEVDRARHTPDPMELCRECIPLLGLPPFAANPLVARSLVAHRNPAAATGLALFAPFLGDADC